MNDIEKIGEILMEEGFVTAEELKNALTQAGAANSPLGKVLLSSQPPSRAALINFMAGQYKIPRWSDLSGVTAAPECARLVPEEVARKHRLVPLCRAGSILCVAVSDFLNKEGLHEVRRRTGLKVKLIQADAGQILKFTDVLYRKPSPVVPAVPPRSTPTQKDSLPAPQKLIPIPVRSAPADGHDSGKDIQDWRDKYAGRKPLTPIKLG